MDPQRIHPLRNQPPTPSVSSDTSFLIPAISILGIFTTAILLLSYYIFVMRPRSDVIGQLSRAHSLYHSVYSSRGLHESVIQAIPTIRFKRGDGVKVPSHECAVCLNEFNGEERVRLLPNCFHVFHIDCIDIWLQTNANCPLCRSEISPISPIQTYQFLAQSPHHDNRIVINDGASRPFGNKGMKLHHACSMGDECVDVRKKDEQFTVQPMRRSFSMDSSCDKQLQLAVTEILQQKAHFKELDGGSSIGQRSIF